MEGGDDYKDFSKRKQQYPLFEAWYSYVVVFEWCLTRGMVLQDMESNDACSKTLHGDDYQEMKLGNKLHRAFIAEVGEEMCQAEVAHHAKKVPEYLCSRPEKYGYLYKKALASSATSAQSDDWEAMSMVKMNFTL